MIGFILRTKFRKLFDMMNLQGLVRIAIRILTRMEIAFQNPFSYCGPLTSIGIWSKFPSKSSVSVVGVFISIAQITFFRTINSLTALNCRKGFSASRTSRKDSINLRTSKTSIRTKLSISTLWLEYLPTVFARLFRYARGFSTSLATKFLFISKSPHYGKRFSTNGTSLLSNMAARRMTLALMTHGRTFLVIERNPSFLSAIGTGKYFSWAISTAHKFICNRGVNREFSRWHNSKISIGHTGELVNALPWN